MSVPLRRQWILLALVIAAYLVSFAAFFPNVITVTDEAAYLRQAASLARGESVVRATNAFTGRSEPIQVSNYPPGTSLLMTPFVAIGGWRAAFALGALCLAATAVLLAWWLASEGRPPLFALLWLMYPPALVISRCAMSDLPSTLLVTAALVMFWRRGGRRHWMIAAGFLAGVSFTLRDTNPIILAPFVVGAIVRRERGAWSTIVAVAAGASLRFLTSLIVYGELVHRNPGIFGFSLSAPIHTLPIHFFALLVLVPGGLVFAALYRGSRRPELLTTLALFVAVHLFYTYDASSSGGMKQLVLAARYFCPLVPLLVFAAAESIPRIADGILVASRRALSPVATVFAVAVAGEVVGVNYYHARWSLGQRAIVDALYARTVRDRPVITNLMVTRKYLNELYEQEFGPRLIVDIDTVTRSRLGALLSAYGSVDVALLDRRDSEYWRTASDADQAKLKTWEGAFALEPAGGTATLAGVGAVRLYSLQPK